VEQHECRAEAFFLFVGEVSLIDAVQGPSSTRVRTRSVSAPRRTRPELVGHVVGAERAGFDFCVTSGHYFAWLESQGHAPYAGACSVPPAGRRAHWPDCVCDVPDDLSPPGGGCSEGRQPSLAQAGGGQSSPPEHGGRAAGRSRTTNQSSHRRQGKLGTAVDPA
jgi:hypothetical protein